MMEQNNRRSHDNQWLALLAAWIIVGVPTVWGVSQTIIKALALFR